MNIAAQKAILRVFRQSGIEAGGSLTKTQLLLKWDGFKHDIDDLDEGIEGLIEAQELDAEDERRGPFLLTEDGYQASLSFE